MKTRLCDICMRDATRVNHLVPWFSVLSWETGRFGSITRTDLCSDCFRDMQQWIKDKRRKS